MGERWREESDGDEESDGSDGLVGAMAMVAMVGDGRWWAMGGDGVGRWGQPACFRVSRPSDGTAKAGQHQITPFLAGISGEPKKTQKKPDKKPGDRRNVILISRKISETFRLSPNLPGEYRHRDPDLDTLLGPRARRSSRRNSARDEKARTTDVQSQTSRPQSPQLPQTSLKQEGSHHVGQKVL